MLVPPHDLLVSRLFNQPNGLTKNPEKMDASENLPIQEKQNFVGFFQISTLTIGDA